MSHRVNASMAPEFWQSLADDVATAVSVPWGVHDQSQRRWLFTTPGFAPVAIAHEYPADGLVVCFAGSVTHVDADPADTEAAVVAVADLLQSLVIDELGAGWPEYEENGAFVGLLQPGVDETGRPGWMLLERARASLGDLRSIAEHLVRRSS